MATVTIEDDLIEQARAATGIGETATLLRDGLRALIARKVAEDVIALGGSDPDAWAPNEGDEPPL